MASAAESFRPLTRELERLDEKDPILAAQAARLVALYRRLWESYVAKNAESQRLDKENQQLKNANASLSEEKKQQSAAPWNMTSYCPTTRKHTRRSKKASSGFWKIGRSPGSTPQTLARRSKMLDWHFSDQGRTRIGDGRVRVATSGLSASEFQQATKGSVGVRC